MNFKNPFSSSSFKAIKDIFKLLPNRSFNPLCILLISNLLSGLIEFFVIILFVPLTSIVLKPEFKTELKLPSFLNYFNYIFSDNLFVYLFILLILLSFILKILSNFFTINFSAKFATYLSSLVYESFSNEPFEISNLRHSSFLYDLLGPKINATVAIMDRFLFLLSNLFISLFIVYALLNISLKLTIYGIIGFAIFYYLIIICIRPTILNNSKIQSELTSECAQLSTDTSLGLRDIILQNKFTEIISSYLNFDRKIRKSVVINNLLSMTPKFILEFFVILIFPLLIIFQNLFSFDYLLVSILGAFLLGLQKLLPSFQVIYSSYTTINSNIFALREIQTFLNSNKSKLIIDNKFDLIKKKNKLIKFDSLIFSSVFFRYINSNSFSIENLSFEIISGDIVLIEGPSGTGKSTTVDLIVGLLQPTSGEILLNNRSLNDISNYQLIDNWRYSLSYVSQQPYFPSSSIAKIISGTDISGSIDKDLIFESIKIACLEDFVYDLPDGINTLLNQNAKNLSGGQRQRLAFARALYKKPSFMILDEFTSALDKNTESKILRNIKLLSFKTTIIVISHNASSDNYFNKKISIKGINK